MLCTSGRSRGASQCAMDLVWPRPLILKLDFLNLDFSVVMPNAGSNEFNFSVTSSCCSLKKAKPASTPLFVSLSLTPTNLRKQVVYRHKITKAVYNRGFATLWLQKVEVLDSIHTDQDVVISLVTNQVTEKNDKREQLQTLFICLLVCM